MNKERDYFFDNLKAVLIFLVVLGHFLLPIHGESVLVVVKRLIYVFHMPLFVFVSGYFAKKIYKNGQYNFKKILYLCLHKKKHPYHYKTKFHEKTEREKTEDE